MWLVDPGLAVLFPAMDPFATRRSFPSPGNVRDLPGVTKHTPIPKRAIPLAGTKAMKCPKDEHLRDLVTARAVEVILPSRTADILGILAMALAVGLIFGYWLDRIFVAPEESWIRPGIGFFFLASFHLLVVFSQILSSGRNQPGALAIVVLYAGIVLSVIADWLIA